MYQSLESILKEASAKELPFWEVILLDDMEQRMVSREESMEKMHTMYEVMKKSDADYDGDLYSSSGLVGNDGEKLRKAREKGQMICGDFMGSVMEKAVKMGESNACMRRIVAAPTAGSCGVLPAVLISMQEKYGYSEEEMTKAMYVAAGIGGVIAYRASISGAAGGCQAEIGSASAMAAGAAVYLRGGDETAMVHAAAIALKNLLGLACDPVCGLVEVPCVKRNVVGAVNALSSADMALCGIQSKIPPDQVIDAMKSVGNMMPDAIKETGNGGLAVTPRGLELKAELNYG